MKRVLLLIVGILLIFALANLCFSLKERRVKEDLVNRVNSALKDSSISGVEASGIGGSLKLTEDIKIGGVVDTQEERDRAYRVAKSVVGSANVDNQIRVKESREPKESSNRGFNSSQSSLLESNSSKKLKIVDILIDSNSSKNGVNIDKNESNQSLESVKIEKSSELNKTDRIKKESNLDSNISSKIIELESNKSVEVVDVEENKSEIESDRSLRLNSEVNVSKSLDLDKKSKLDSNKEVCQRDFKNLLSKNRIHFRYASATIKRESFKLLDKLVDIANKCPNAKIVIEGHTDSHGKRSYNKRLSLERAIAVKRYLIKKGVSANRLKAIGYGELRPIATNKTAKGRSINRRIEFKVEGVKR